MVGPEQHPALAERRLGAGGQLGAGDELFLQAGAVALWLGLHLHVGLAGDHLRLLLHLLALGRASGLRRGAWARRGGVRLLALCLLPGLLLFAIGDGALSRVGQLAGRLVGRAAGDLGLQPAPGINFRFFQFARTGAKPEAGDGDRGHGVFIG